MTWFKVDDLFPDDPDTLSLGDPGAYLFLAMLAYCSRHETDGTVPKAAVRKGLTHAKRPLELAKKMSALGWLEDRGDDLYVRNYLKYQRSAAEVQTIREARAEAGRKGAASKAEAKALAKAQQTRSKPGNKTPTDTDTERDTDTEEELKDQKLRAEFEAFWKDYPLRNGSKGSRKNAERVWKSLPQTKREQAHKALPSYALAAKGFPKDAERYLRGEAWEGIDPAQVGRNGSPFPTDAAQVYGGHE